MVNYDTWNPLCCLAIKIQHHLIKEKNIIEEKGVVLTFDQKQITNISPLIIEKQLKVVPER